MVVANFHQVYNYFNEVIKSKNLNNTILQKNYIKILQSMYPVLPHLISECLAQFDEKILPEWPEIDNEALRENFSKIVIQINGKKRGVRSFKKDIVEQDLIKEIINNDEYSEYFENKKILKKFYVQNKIINFIVE